MTGVQTCALPILSFSGCNFNNPEELERLVKEDGGFRQMIQVRDQTHGEIRSIKNDLLTRKKTMDAQIDRLRGEYDAYAKAQNLKIDKYQANIEANRNLLKREAETGGAQMTAKKTELDGYRKTLDDVKKVLKSGKSIHLSDQERQKWEERVLMLSEKIRPLTEEIRELEAQVRLKKSKASFLN